MSRRWTIDRPGPGEELNTAGEVTVPRQAATVILLRGGADALELLLVQRTPKARFMGGVWVFPGGAVDAHEGEGDAAHRVAARPRARGGGRRSRGVDPAALVKFSRWITPAEVTIRFDTHFFLAPAARRRRAGRRRRGVRRPRLVHAAGRARRPRRAARSCSSSRRSSTSSSSRCSPRADALLDARARPRGPARQAAGRRRGRDRARAAARRAGLRRRVDPDAHSLEAPATPVPWASPSPSPGRPARSASRSSARSSAARDVKRIVGHGAAAVRPGLTAGEDRVPPGRRARPRRGRARSSTAPTSSCTSRSSSCRRRTRRATSTSRARATSSRAARDAGRAAARLHVVGRRLRLPRRQPDVADRGRRRRAGTDAPPVLRAEGGASSSCSHEALAGVDTDAYVFRPCIVAGPDAPMLLNAIPYVQLGEQLPGAVRALFDQVPVLKPVLPDPGVPFQLVHHDDVAAALRAAVARQRRARRLQPRRPGPAHGQGPRRRARLVQRAGPRARGRRDRRGRRAAAVPARRRRAGSRRSAVRC